MVSSTADSNGILFKRTHIRSSLASVEQGGIRSLKLLHILSCNSCDTAHTLKIVKRSTLATENCLNIAVNNTEQIALLNLVSVLKVSFKSACVIKKLKGALKNIKTADNAILLADKVSLALPVLRHNCISRNVLRCNVLS